MLFAGIDLYVLYSVLFFVCGGDNDQSHSISRNTRGVDDNATCNLIRYSRSSFGSWNLQLPWHTRNTRREHENTVHETVLKCIRRINIRTWAALWVGFYINNTVHSVVGYLPHHTAAQQQSPVLNIFTILLGETVRTKRCKLVVLFTSQQDERDKKQHNGKGNGVALSTHCNFSRRFGFCRAGGGWIHVHIARLSLPRVL